MKQSLISFVSVSLRGKETLQVETMCFDTCLSVIQGAKANLLPILYKHK